MAMPRTDRRRFLAISAVAAAGLPGTARAAPPLVVWRGQALGAMASIRLAHPDRMAAERLIGDCVAEIARLEAIFSLYRADSAVCRLNTEGALDAPPLELVELLSRCAAFSERTGGVFDVTVQPLFRRYAEHFAAPDADPAGPPIEDALALVGWRGVEIGPERVAFARPGMVITLNGVAQGYITDRVAELLRAHGMTDVLVDLGELRALGRHPEGRPWRAGLPGRAETFDLVDGAGAAALAVSSGAGSPFEPTSRLNHLLDPATGRCAAPERLVAVLARDATTADAVATALAVASTPRALAAALPEIQALILPGSDA